MIPEEVHPLDDLRVPDDEAEPPAGHPVALRHGEELDADLPRARLGEEAPRLEAVEHEIGVGEVVDDDGTGLRRVGDGLGEDARRGRGRARVRGIVEVEGGDAVPRDIEARSGAKPASGSSGTRSSRAPASATPDV